MASFRRVEEDEDNLLLITTSEIEEFIDEEDEKMEDPVLLPHDEAMAKMEEKETSTDETLMFEDCSADLFNPKVTKKKRRNQKKTGIDHHHQQQGNDVLFREVQLPPPPPFTFKSKEEAKAFILQVLSQEKRTANVKIETYLPDAIVPKRGTPGSAGYDIFCPRETWVEPGESKQINLGWRCILPHNTRLSIQNRSGWAIMRDMNVKGQPTTIDSDFRGGVSIFVENKSKESYCIKQKAKIAQMFILEVLDINWEHVEKIKENDEGSTRGSGGFGSTGF